MSFVRFMCSPVGTLKIVSNGEGITEISFFEGDREEENGDIYTDKAIEELEEYFAGKRKEFTLPLVIEGTPFRQRVWKELINIDYGKTVSYKYIAERIGCPCARAIGGANNKNKIVIVIPCHRVVGAGGSLTGYGGGLWRKEILLNIERKVIEGEK